MAEQPPQAQETPDSARRLLQLAYRTSVGRDRIQRVSESLRIELTAELVKDDDLVVIFAQELRRRL